MSKMFSILVVLVGLTIVAGCKRDAEKEAPEKSPPPAKPDDTHAHDDGTTHEDHGMGESAEGEDHAHDEVPLGKVTIGELEVELAQGHGKVEAGKESHLVVKLPHNDKGETIVRAWLGTEDRTNSVVGKGEYAPSHNDYDVHAVAPDPLPDNVRWWIEIQKPDGTKIVGSIEPRMD